MNTEQNPDREQLESTVATPFTWRVDSASFDATLISSLRAKDTVPVIIMLDEISRDAVALLLSEDEDARKELRSMLDKLACVAAAALRFRDLLLFDSCAKTAFSVYMSGFDERGNQISPRSSHPRVSSPLLWFELAKRIIAIGGFAVRRRDWRAVRELALQITADRYSVSHGESQYWLSHAVTEADNAGIVDASNSRRRHEGYLISETMKLVERESCLRPDLPADDYRLVQSLLGFDLLATLVVSADAGEFNTSYVYHSFIYWELSQVEPLLVQLLRNEVMRGEIFSTRVEDEFLSSVLRGIAKVAGQRSQARSRWSAKAVNDFLNKHPDTSSNT